jgi:hypothetical protein
MCRSHGCGCGRGYGRGRDDSDGSSHISRNGGSSDAGDGGHGHNDTVKLAQNTACRRVVVHDWTTRSVAIPLNPSTELASLHRYHHHRHRNQMAVSFFTDTTLRTWEHQALESTAVCLSCIDQRL